MTWYVHVTFGSNGFKHAYKQKLLFQAAYTELELSLTERDPGEKDRMMTEVCYGTALCTEQQAQQYLQVVWEKESSKLITIVRDMKPTIDLSVHEGDVKRVYLRAQVCDRI